MKYRYRIYPQSRTDWWTYEVQVSKNVGLWHTLAHYGCTSEEDGVKKALEVIEMHKKERVRRKEIEDTPWIEVE